MAEVPEETASHPVIVKKHFRAFDTLRFFAFLKVFLQHIPVVAFAWFNILRAGGIIGVQFFFVLSGFLITYIILNEKSQTGTLHLKNFFARRILRIWPLFYLIVAVSYAIPFILGLLHQPKVNTGYHPTWWVSLLFLENYKMIFTHSMPNVEELSITWSLCIEEHFYIVWGLLLCVIPVKYFPRIAATAIVTAIISRFVFFHYHLDPTDLFTNIDLFAFGAIPAYMLVCHNDKTEALIRRMPHGVHVLVFVCTIAYVLVSAQVKNIIANNLWLTTTSGIMFSTLIFFTMYDVQYFRTSALISKLGTYTYGLYMYHVLIIVLLVRVFDRLHYSLDRPLYAAMFTFIALAGTILCSMASYHFFEKPFLKLKRFFR